MFSKLSWPFLKLRKCQLGSGKCCPANGGGTEAEFMEEQFGLPEGLSVMDVITRSVQQRQSSLLDPPACLVRMPRPPPLPPPAGRMLWPAR